MTMGRDSNNWGSRRLVVVAVVLACQRLRPTWIQQMDDGIEMCSFMRNG